MKVVELYEEFRSKQDEYTNEIDRLKVDFDKYINNERVDLVIFIEDDFVGYVFVHGTITHKIMIDIEEWVIRNGMQVKEYRLYEYGIKIMLGVEE